MQFESNGEKTRHLAKDGVAVVRRQSPANLISYKDHMSKKTKTQANKFSEGTKEENDRWKRFKRETIFDRLVLVALLNARAAQSMDSRAARVYDQMIMHLMAVYVSPAALERYEAGISDEEFERMFDGECTAVAGVVDNERGMLAALKAMVVAHPDRRHSSHRDFVDHLYLRWQYVEMAGVISVDALSANGANVISI